MPNYPRGRKLMRRTKLLKKNRLRIFRRARSHEENFWNILCAKRLCGILVRQIAPGRICKGEEKFCFYAGGGRGLI